MAENLQKTDQGRIADRCIMVIFGASGDLTTRMLLPALYNLARNHLLPEEFAILGFAKDPFSEEDFRKRAREDIRAYAGAPEKCDLCDWIVGRLFYMTGDFASADDFAKLKDRIDQLDQQYKTSSNVFYYLATLPQFISEIIRQLGAQGLTNEDHDNWRRVIIEKPFGNDLESAKNLNLEIAQVLKETQIFRIDHYLGKETVQNILVFRFSNGIFEPVWNRRYIDHVEITVAETLGVERRGGYYEHAGALRDMIPNHLLQLVSLTAMEPPISFAADAVRDEQAKVLHAIQPIQPEDVLTRAVRGQYGEGAIAGQNVEAYRSEEFVDAHSNVETFVALKLQLDNWRWADVPFYIRTGKRLAKRATEIVIQFRRAPFVLFRDTPVDKLTPNVLVIHIQPDEGISLSFGAKIPGAHVRLGDVKMDFHYADYFGAEPSTGYERLLYDCMIGDATLFQRADMVEAGWAVVEPVLDVWKALPARSFPNYAAGSWGPKEAEELIRRDGRRWRVE
ncbi:MAG TPA: glucose-6-phosphate dehydrogenase [Bryobacteraceae bacterium]|jgi:glucose-6-phosphate 1-dehydrogenase|nr:glucose-6-phosphate dehydrogenase [Bryobacteraceae bacterium]